MATKAKKKGILERLAEFLFGTPQPKRKSARKKTSKKSTSKRGYNVRTATTTKSKVGYSNSKSKGKRRGVRKNGFAWTKKVPHKNHPAYFKRTGKDTVEYVTFTHSATVDFDKDRQDLPIEKHDTVETIKLNAPIDPKEKNLENTYSYVVPRVYESTRSSLGVGTDDFRLTKEDYELVRSLFSTAPRYQVQTTSNSENKKDLKATPKA